MSLGAAYHYFPSKDAIVLAYYDQVQEEHARRVRDTLPGTKVLTDRLRAVIHAKLDILADDRRLLGALLRYTGDASHPLSFLGPGTRRLRQESTALFADALAGERLQKDVRALAPTALWALHMGLLLYFLYDESPGQARTRALADGAVDLAVRLLSIAGNPLLAPLRRKVVALLNGAGLLPGVEEIARYQAPAEPSPA
jgi:AcrR family transcriptional regulator